ncbi:MAG: BREX-1 system adenine-specific DNA-methyltransferase PglX, partial [Oscillospiraceae bacterium]|nr:BREX-1 system adenine-specific DNA-methyltransferase PglX [Oscillospiraceae bacterium]
MNKTAIKNFAIWARNKLIADISYKAGLMGITEDGVKSALPQSTKDVEFYDIGTKEPYSITGKAIAQRRKLAELIGQKEKASDYQTAYREVIEEAAYTWFNRLIAIRFMEVNDYLPSRIRVLSSESGTKLEPDLVTTPFDAELGLSDYEQSEVLRLKKENKVDELFQMLFIRQCNELNQILPKLFERTADYTELLLNVSVTDQDGVVYRLVHDIPEDDFNISKTDEGGKPTGQVEIIGWLYQYYNTEPKDEAFALLKKNVKITKERIPAATQLFTPDWIVRYMVENILGRLWLEGHPNDDLKAGWKYYLDESQQEADVETQLAKIWEEYKTIRPEDIKVIDPCMGSWDILVYAFDVLMQIYESAGYTQRDAAKSILEHNLYGLDIDDRAFQLAYFAVMMKARQYNRRILNGETDCHVYAIQESNTVRRAQLKYFGADINDLERNNAMNQITGLLDTLTDAKEYGSILNVEPCNWDLLRRFASKTGENAQMSMDSMGLEETKAQLQTLINIGEVMAQKYHVTCTNPPYMSSGNMDDRLLRMIKQKYPSAKNDTYSAFILRCKEMTKASYYYAMITMQGWMFTQRFEDLRGILLKDSLCTMLHVGYNSFPELNSKIAQATTFVFNQALIYGYKAKYFDLTNQIPQNANKQEVFEKKLSENKYISISNDKFKKLPGYQFAYWVSENLLMDFCNGKRLGDLAAPRQGLATGDNDSFLRIWFEVANQKIGLGYTSTQVFHESGNLYAPYNKGGEYCKWYGNRDLIIKFDMANYSVLQSQGNHLPSKQYYFCECGTWSALTTSGFSCRYCENGFVFDTKGSSCFCNSRDELFSAMGFLNSCVANEIFKMLSPTVDYNAGTVANVPILRSVNETANSVVKACIALSKMNWDSYETSWDFERHPLIRSHTTVAEAFLAWNQECADRFNTLKSNEEALNRIFIDVYSLQDELTPEVADKDVTIRKADLGRDIRSLLSYAVGCMFGRYSLDVDGLAYAGGDWDDSKYSTFIHDKDNILPITDEEYFEDDIVGLFCAWLKKV